MRGALDVNPCDWFAAQIWAGREQMCAKHLRLRGYDVFLPMYSEVRRWSDRIKLRERPLFEGYLFCRTGGAVTGTVVATPGVIRLVGDGHRPLPVPTHEIETIQRIVDAGLRVEPWDRLEVGQRVRVDVGPLRGTEGVVLRARNSHRLIVAISMLQRAVAVELDAAWLSPTQESKQAVGLPTT